MISVYSGRWTTKHYPKKASTAFAANSLVDVVAGFAQPSTSSTGATDTLPAGVYEGPAIASSSTTTDLIPVRIPVGAGMLLCDVTGTLASTDPGKGKDLSDSQTVNAAGNTNKPLSCERFISATQGIFAFNKPLINA